MTTLNDILEAIAEGVADDRDAGSAIVSALNRRSRYIQNERGARQTAGLKAGDRARFTSNVKPRALVGVEVTILKTNPKSMLVELDPVALATRPDLAKYSGEFRCPLSILEAVA